jgi:hypothetical protein
MVRRQHAEPGTAVGVRVGDRVVPATVSALPFRLNVSPDVAPIRPDAR